MIQRYFLTIGVLNADRMTPVLTALFDGFALKASRTELESIASPPTWLSVLEQLRSLAQNLAIDVPEGGLDSMPAALLLLAAHFRRLNDPALARLIEANHFERNVDLDTLFTIAKLFDDGHGLTGVWLDAEPYREDRAHSSTHLAHELLDLLAELLPGVTDVTDRAQLRERLATILVNAGDVVSDHDSPPQPH
jgi:hypothetical protein